MARPTHPLRRLPKTHPRARELRSCDYPSFGPNGNLAGMRRNYGWQDAMPVKCGVLIYDVRADPTLYDAAK